MHKLLFRLGFIILLGIFLLAYVFPWRNYGIQPPFPTKDYKLGLDLQGGVELDYKVDLTEAKQEEDYSPQKEKQILEGLKSVIDKRVEALNINDSIITTANYAGEQHVIVQIPLKGKNPEEDALNIARAKKAIGKVMKIVFKERRIEVTQKDLDERVKIAQNALKDATESQYHFGVTQAQYRDNYPDVLMGETNTITDIFSGSLDAIPEGLSKSTIDATNLATGDEGFLILEKDEAITKYLFIAKKPSDWIPAQDTKGRILNDRYFVKSSVQYNDAFQPMVELTFNDEGAKIFGELSTRLVHQQMAIFVGGEMLTAPNINEPILSGKAVITGNYTPEEASKLANDINTGVVPAPIYLTSEKAIDSKLGADSLQKLIVAGVLGFILIFVFLIFVYRLSGFLASVSLLLYVAIILTIVKVLGITLTLASIAGLILSIGMAIDANILIFERVRDELRNGEKLLKAAKTGFKKSWSAIWDSNVTGLIVALILFIFGINLIKGFGLMLALGILVSLFSVMWISRVLVFLVAQICKSKKRFIGK